MIDYDYVPYYCEENVWRLLSRSEFAARDAYALFIFGASGRVAIYGQKAGDAEYGGLALWDYHVAALDWERRILDFDTVGPFSAPAADYLETAFGPFSGCRELDPYLPLFRLVPAAAYRDFFDSDRSHMLDSNGRYVSSPPPWPCPASKDPAKALSLRQLIDPAAGCADFGGGCPLKLAALLSFIGI